VSPSQFIRRASSCMPAGIVHHSAASPVPRVFFRAFASSYPEFHPCSPHGTSWQGHRADDGGKGTDQEDQPSAKGEGTDKEEQPSAVADGLNEHPNG